jgi:hypothetical protein
MTTTRENSHVERAFVQVGCIAAILLTISILAVGLDSLRRPVAVEKGAFLANHPVILGATFVAISSIIIFWTANRWIKVLPGLIGYALVGALIATSNGGFQSRIASRNLSLRNTILLAILLIIDCALAFRLSKRKISVIDRLALLVFVLSLALSMMSDPKPMFEDLLVGTLSLLLANFIHRLGILSVNSGDCVDQD